MNKIKVSSKQERDALVLSFLSSGKTKTLWCKENGIALRKRQFKAAYKNMPMLVYFCKFS